MLCEIHNPSPAIRERLVASRPGGRAAHALLASVAAAACGCAPYPLHSNMTDDQIRIVLDENFKPGQSLAEVDGRLDDLRVSGRYRTMYPKTDSRPEVLLARLYPPGGFWLDQEDQLLKFVDVSFVFDDNHSLVRFPIYRDGIRYFQGDPIYGPTRTPRRPVPHYPANPPPPADPLEGMSTSTPTK